MDSPNDHETAQRIFKAMEEQREVLKKMAKMPHIWKFIMMMKGKVRMKEIRPNMKETSNLRSSQQTPWP